ncbi:MAG: hypothetical protein HZB99_04330 [Candidatus Harrisonbacteria bacterium]|nr:hypothetical protein [Candidatus Harrisonbacteria bacterium]
MKHEPKISTSEIVYVGLVFILFDVISVGLAAVGFGFILVIISSLSTFYLRMKGVSLIPDLIAKVFEATPIGILPMFTIGWIATVIVDRSGLQEIATAAVQKTSAGTGPKPAVK